MHEHRHYSPALAELDALLCDPALRGRWPEGFTVDDVLAELMTLGRVAIDVRDDLSYSGDALPFACRLELHDAGATFGEGRTRWGPCPATRPTPRGPAARLRAPAPPCSPRRSATRAGPPPPSASRP